MLKELIRIYFIIGGINCFLTFAACATDWESTISPRLGVLSYSAFKESVDSGTVARNNKLYRVYTKGSFDCVHLGHFALFANIKRKAAEYFKCELHQISLIALLSTQDGGKHKGVEYKQSELKRKRDVLSTGIVNHVDFCEETIDFVQLNIDKIDLFAVGFDQSQTEYFDKIIRVIEDSNKGCIKMEYRLPSLSSTIIRDQVDMKETTIEAARSSIESSYKLDEESKRSIAALYLESVITSNNLEKFNLSLKNLFGSELRIYLGGCQATGKTTIAKEFKRRYPSFQRFTSSEAFMECLGISREELEYIDETDPDLVDRVILSITENNQKLFLDGHFLFGARSQNYSFDTVIFASASIDEILKRKITDRNRERKDNLTLQTVFGEYYLKIVRACKFSDKVFVLDNTGSLEETMEKLERIVICSKFSKDILKEKNFIFADDVLNNLLAGPIKKQEIKLNNSYLREQLQLLPRVLTVGELLPKEIEYIAINIPQNLLVDAISLAAKLIPKTSCFTCKPNPYHVTLVHSADKITEIMRAPLQELITKVTTQEIHANITIIGVAYNVNALCLLVELPNGLIVTSGYPHITIGLRNGIPGIECLYMLRTTDCVTKLFDIPITITDLPIVKTIDK